MKKIINTIDGTIYAVGNNNEELVQNWNENIKESLEWLLDESTFDDQTTYDELTEEAYRIENIEAVIDQLNDYSENNKIEIIEG
ncbi:hypothetical protein [Peptoniphilus vaginalis]|uniref:hypothetical protein n=1 Tax=Peptoniphilus vaginalis TaxID=1756987 RepID=UPI0023F8E360|nr:hypothetical protein [Peptoniphilus vaginalis]